jgi:hypothetical protein
VFTTHDTLHHALTTTGTFSGLYTALMASTPPLSVRTHADQPTGLMFFEQSPYMRNSPINDTITIDLESGAILMHANGYTGFAGTPHWKASPPRRPRGRGSRRPTASRARSRAFSRSARTSLPRPASAAPTTTATSPTLASR